MPSKDSLTLLERQVALPARRRLWFFVFCCVSASMIGAAFVVASSMRQARLHHHQFASLSQEPVSELAPCRGSTCACPSTTMNAVVTRGEWQSLGDPEGLTRSPRIVPAFREGKAIGFKLYAIAPQSIWARIGLENGDTLQKIQEHEMQTPDQVITLYSQLRSEEPTTIYVELLRDGCPASLELSVLPG